MPLRQKQLVTVTYVTILAADHCLHDFSSQPYHSFGCSIHSDFQLVKQHRALHEVSKSANIL